MRLNRSEKTDRGWTKASGSKDKFTKPKFVAPDVLIGRVSSEMMELSYAPRMSDLATKSTEMYADELLEYHTKLREFREANQKIAEPSATEEENEDDAETVDEAEEPPIAEMEVEADGTVKSTDEEELLFPDFPEPPKPLFHSQYMTDEFVATISDVSDHFSSSGGWKVHANAAKFERSLDEKYGFFRPIITNHPEIEVFIRSVQRKYEMGYFSPLRQGSPPIPKSTSVIILFMMQRNSVRWDALILAALFLLVGLQPWALVTLVAIVQQMMNRRTMRPCGGMSSYIEPVEPYWRVQDKVNEQISEMETKKSILLQPVGTPLGAEEKIDGKLYDTILIGSGPGTLYTGALLARAGRKILVLSPGADASGCLTLEGATNTKFNRVPFDIESSNISRISRQQELLAPALCTTSDYQGGVRFSQIGSEADGYAFEILSIPGMGADDIDGQIPFVLRAAGGQQEFMDDAATLLGDGWPGSDGSLGSSTSGMYLGACASINASAGGFYLTKIIPENSKSLQSASNYQEGACRYASSLLNQCFPMNPHLRSLMAGIGMKAENLPPGSTSLGAHVSTICAATSGEGMHYPVGGPRSLCHALASVIEQCGGRVVTLAQVKELLFDEVQPNVDNSSTDPVPPPCVGVKMSNDQAIIMEKSDDKETAVVNMRGFIDTFVRLLPEDIRIKHKVPMGLPALSERRPVFKILFGLKGSADDLSVTGADFYRLPNASLARDQIEPETGAIVLGEVGSSNRGSQEPNDETQAGIAVDETNEELNETKTDDAAQGGLRGKRSKVSASTKQAAKVKFDAGVSWMQISFPSAKDPSWEERHGKITTCVVTIEADDDFVVPYDTKPKLYSVVPNKVQDQGNRTRLMERVKRDLLQVYPQLEGKIDQESLTGPFSKGLSHTPERYAAKGVRADTPYPGLFVGGSDLTVGDSFSGSIVGSWLVSNAVIGYGAVDLLFLEKNITTDLAKFMEHPGIPEDPESEIAVPFEPRTFEEESDEVLQSS